MNWIASILIILGYICIANKWKWGFAVQLLGCLIYIFLFYEVDWSIVLVNTAFTLINIYGFWRWSDDTTY